MQYLKADTGVKVVVGPCVAVGDGFTPVTTLALTTADEAEILKHDAAAVTSISANTFAAITSADGYYNLTLTAAQLDTEGMLTVLINDDSLCLPIRNDFMVVNANVYDSLFAAATTDYLQVDMIQIAGNATNATNVGTAGSNYSATRGLSGTALPAAAADAAGGLPISDLGGLDMDAILADTADMQPKLGTFADLGAGATLSGNLEDMRDDGTAVFSRATDSLQAIRDHIGNGTNLTEAGGDGDHLTAINLPDQTMNITGNLSGSVGSVTGNVGGNVTGSVGSNLELGPAEVNAECDTAITDAALATAANLATVDGVVDAIKVVTDALTSAAATKLAASMLGVHSGAFEGVPTTTSMQTDLAELTDDHYKGSVLVITSGAGAGERTDITAYTGATGTLTVTAVTTAPAAADTFIIV